MQLLCPHTYKDNNQSLHWTFLHKPTTKISYNFLPSTIHMTLPGNNENLTVLLSRLHCSQVPEMLTAQHHKTLSSSQSITRVNKEHRVLHKLLRDRHHCVLHQFSSGLFNLSIMLWKGRWFRDQKTSVHIQTIAFTGYVIQGKSYEPSLPVPDL